MGRLDRDRRKLSQFLANHPGLVAYLDERLESGLAVLVRLGQRKVRAGELK
jgi:hypothetical protein